MPTRRSFEAQLTLLHLAVCVPLFMMLIATMIYGGLSKWLVALTLLIGSLAIVFTSYRLFQKADYQFRSLGNLLDAMIQGDYSMRARSGRSDGALDDLVQSINALASRLNTQRAESVESQRLVRTVIDHIDVAILALDTNNGLKFVNPAATRLLRLEGDGLSDQLLTQLSAVQSLPSGSHQLMALTLADKTGRFNVHIEHFHEAGVENKLLFITDVRTLLRSEERKAWQSLVRVISHEINNSLSPIASISQTLTKLVESDKMLHTEFASDAQQGLALIHERAKGLMNFVESYRQLAQLPAPQKQETDLKRLAEKCAHLFTSTPITIHTEHNDIFAYIDPVQIEQVLINLVKNAIEAAPHSPIEITLHSLVDKFSLTIEDSGPGISNRDNLFVPFYSTKKGGSGIGLALSRQIVEAHGGQLFLQNKPQGSGCQAIIEITH